ncbi:MAG: DUF2459 domain-containing protein, partial [Pseudomonadota bacterium]|nr:DUF2459 domain-containing protein [Pseudomonadota bacterium]
GRAAVATLLMAVAGLAVTTALTARRGDRHLYPPRRGDETVDVYIVRNWLHANLAVPTGAAGWSGPAVDALGALPAAAPYVLLGWGDAKHFRERGKTLLRALDLWRSFLIPNNPAVILVNPLPAAPTPQTMGKPVVKLSLSREGFEALIARLNRSFLVQDGRPVAAGRGREPDSLFFSSREGSDLLHVCNHWVAHLLDAAGVPTRPVLDTITAGLAWDLKQRGGAQDVEGALGPPPDLGLETPPVNSGRFEPMNDAARGSGAIHFEGYAIRFGRGSSYETAPLALIKASEPAAGGRSYAELLNVSADSLVETRAITTGEAGRGPWRAELQFLALGFRPNGGKRYEIALAAYEQALSEAPCAVLQFRQA